MMKRFGYLPILDEEHLNSLNNMSKCDTVIEFLNHQSFERVGLDRFYAILADIAENYGRISGFRVLDIGCNSGLFASSFAAFGNQSTGIDSMQIDGQGRYTPLEFNQSNSVEFHKVDVQEFLENTDRKYDFTLLLSVAHQWEFGYAQNEESSKSADYITAVMDQIVSHTCRAIYYECPMDEPGFEESYGVTFLSRFVSQYTHLSIVKICDTVASNGYLRCLYRITMPEEQSGGIAAKRQYDTLMRIKTKHQIYGEIVGSGHFPDESYYFLGIASMVVPITRKERVSTHPMGKQNNSRSEVELWECVRDASIPNVVRIINIFPEEMYAVIELVAGTPAQVLSTLPLWQEKQILCHPEWQHPADLLVTQKRLSSLSFGLQGLHDLNVAHGDPYPFNAIVTMDTAVWIDLGNISDDPRQILMDNVTFVLFTVSHLLCESTEISDELLRRISAISRNAPTVKDFCANLADVFSTCYTDIRPAEEKDTLLIQKVVWNVAAQQLNTARKTDGWYLPIRAIQQYYNDMIVWQQNDERHAEISVLKSMAAVYWQYENRRLRRSADAGPQTSAMPVQNQSKSLPENMALPINGFEWSDLIVALQNIGDAFRVHNSMGMRRLVDDLRAPTDGSEAIVAVETISEVSSQTAQGQNAAIQAELEQLRAELRTLYRELEDTQSTRTLSRTNIEAARAQIEQAVGQLERKHVRRVLKGFGLLSKLRYADTKERLKTCRGILSRLCGSHQPLYTSRVSPFHIMDSSLRSAQMLLQEVNGSEIVLPNQSAWDADGIDHLQIQHTGKKRIAYITNQVVDWEGGHPRFGGGERYLLNLSRLLSRYGYEIHIFQPAFMDSETEYYGFKVTTLAGIDSYSEFNLDKDDRFYKISLEYDHVIYNMPEYASARVRKDALLICHGIWFDHNNYGNAVHFRCPEWFNRLYRVFDNPLKIVSVDTNSINVVRSLFPELARKMVFIPNFADLDQFCPPEQPRRNEKLKILFPRRSQVNRGSRILGEILCRVPYDVEFYWVGEGDAEDTQIILDLAKRDTRLHYEKASFEEMPHWYQLADITVIPTIACEGTSLSCIEAMASGSATIATNVGGLADLIFNDINGLSVNVSAYEIADAINRLITDDATRSRLQTDGRRYAEMFSLKNWESKWLDVFYSLKWIDRPNRSKPRICIITMNAIHGGVEALIKMEAEYFKADVIVTGGHNDPYNSCPFTYMYVKTYKELLSQLTQYDVAIYHWLPEWAVRAIDVSGIFSIEFVHRTDTSACDKKVPNVVASHSQYVLDYIESTYNRREHLCLVPNGTDTERFTPIESREEKCLIGAPTSYYRTKGIDVLIEAWHQLPQKYKDRYRLVLHGAGTDKEDFERMIAEAGEDIQLLGPIVDTKPFYDSLYIYVTAARIEGLPISVLEAMSCNLPVIASDIEGHRVINDISEAAGFDAPLILFKSEDAKDLAKALQSFLDSPKQRNTRPVTEVAFSGKAHCHGLEVAIQRYYIDHQP